MYRNRDSLTNHENEKLQIQDLKINNINIETKKINDQTTNSLLQLNEGNQQPRSPIPIQAVANPTTVQNPQPLMPIPVVQNVTKPLIVIPSFTKSNNSLSAFTNLNLARLSSIKSNSSSSSNSQAGDDKSNQEIIPNNGRNLQSQTSFHSNIVPSPISRAQRDPNDVLNFTHPNVSAPNSEIFLKSNHSENIFENGLNQIITPFDQPKNDVNYLQIYQNLVTNPNALYSAGPNNLSCNNGGGVDSNDHIPFNYSYARSLTENDYIRNPNLTASSNITTSAFSRKMSTQTAVASSTSAGGQTSNNNSIGGGSVGTELFNFPILESKNLSNLSPRTQNRIRDRESIAKRERQIFLQFQGNNGNFVNQSGSQVNQKQTNSSTDCTIQTGGIGAASSDSTQQISNQQIYNNRHQHSHIHNTLYERDASVTSDDNESSPDIPGENGEATGVGKLYDNGGENFSRTNNGLQKTRICNCKKTKCLKLYCDCFAVGELCGPECNCSECCNNSGNLQLRAQTIEGILQKNPYAFNSKSKQSQNQMSGKGQTFSNKQGCNCRRSGCQKQYCLCHSQGLQCGDHCKCTQCQNYDLSTGSAPFSSSNHYENIGNSGGSPDEEYLLMMSMVEPRQNQQIFTNDGVGVYQHQKQHQQIPNINQELLNQNQINNYNHHSVHQYQQQQQQQSLQNLILSLPPDQQLHFINNLTNRRNIQGINC